MIQAANIGIGISGKEGLQAANCSDYSIAQFHFLEKLLLVHGVWNYHRISKTIIYSFYKNVILHFQQIWFAPYNLYSGQNLFERWCLAYYNAFFTMLPPFAIGIFDKIDINKNERRKQYTACQEGRDFTSIRFWWCIMAALFHSLLVGYP